jgi:hypothetical protein
MHQKLCSRSLIVAGAFAAAVAAGACNGNNNTADNNRATGTSASADANQQPMTVTGCLQKAGSDYILTEAMTPAPVGTSGSADTNTAARDQQKAASRSYRLNNDRESNDQMNDMLGKEVRVNGRVTDQANIGTSGSSNSRPGDIDAKDLARIDVASMESISDSCSNSAAHDQNGSHDQDKGSKAKPKSKR